MKRIILLLAFVSFALSPFAQPKGKDYITMKADGKVYWMRSGQNIRMMIDVPLKNGSVVNSKGNITAKDGEVIQLKPGDKVLMDGTMMKGKKKM